MPLSRRGDRHVHRPCVCRRQSDLRSCNFGLRLVRQCCKLPRRWSVSALKLLLVIVAIIAVVVVVGGVAVSGSYNSLVQLDQSTQNAWANVETAYQRRLDLIPNLV